MRVRHLIVLACQVAGCASATSEADWPEEPEPLGRVHFPCAADKVEHRAESDPSMPGPLRPRALFRPAPHYPHAASGLGWVELRFTIDVDGRVCNAWVQASEPPLTFEQSALEALREWRFEPVIAAGRKLALTGARARIEFQPEAAPASGGELEAEKPRKEEGNLRHVGRDHERGDHGEEHRHER